VAGQEKTEKATPKKRKDAREKEGNVLKSKEINTFISLIIIFVSLSLLGPFMLTQMQNVIRFFIGGAGRQVDVNQEFITEIAVRILSFATTIIAPILFIAVLAGVIPTVIQTKGLFTMKPLKPKFSKLNPLKGIKKLFSLQQVVQITKSVIIIAAIVGLVYGRIMNLLPEIRKMMQFDLIQGVNFVATNIFNLVMLIVILIAFVSAADYVFQWWQFEKKLKMSKQEVKDEHKQIEGDPLIKSKIKQKQREVAQSRMMQEVPGADVVVRNPTHYAVALKYDTTILAPMVVAKGRDEIALKIIALAEENDVPIHEDRALARNMHDNVDIGRLIPPELFIVVAEILSNLETFRKKIDLK